MPSIEAWRESTSAAFDTACAEGHAFFPSEEDALAAIAAGHLTDMRVVQVGDAEYLVLPNAQIFYDASDTSPGAFTLSLGTCGPGALAVTKRGALPPAACALLRARFQAEFDDAFAGITADAAAPMPAAAPRSPPRHERNPHRTPTADSASSSASARADGAARRRSSSSSADAAGPIPRDPATAARGTTNARGQATRARATSPPRAATGQAAAAAARTRAPDADDLAPILAAASLADATTSSDAERSASDGSPPRSRAPHATALSAGQRPTQPVATARAARLGAAAGHAARSGPGSTADAGEPVPAFFRTAPCYRRPALDGMDLGAKMNSSHNPRFKYTGPRTDEKLAELAYHTSCIFGSAALEPLFKSAVDPSVAVIVIMHTLLTRGFPPDHAAYTSVHLGRILGHFKPSTWAPRFVPGNCAITNDKGLTVGVSIFLGAVAVLHTMSEDPTDHIAVTADAVTTGVITASGSNASILLSILVPRTMNKDKDKDKDVDKPKSTGPCIAFNTVAGCTRERCRYRHACNLCIAKGIRAADAAHTAMNCPKR